MPNDLDRSASLFTRATLTRGLPEPSAGRPAEPRGTQPQFPALYQLRAEFSGGAEARMSQILDHHYLPPRRRGRLTDLRIGHHLPPPSSPARVRRRETTRRLRPNLTIYY